MTPGEAPGATGPLANEQAQMLLAAIMESSADAIYSKDRDGVLTTWNRGAEQLYGYSAKEAIGRHVSLIVPPSRAGEERTILDRALRSEGLSRYETEQRAHDGRIVEVSLTASPIRRPDGEVMGVAVIAHDISKRRADEAAVRDALFRASHDELTGLPNGRRFKGLLDDAASRQGAELTVAVMSLDNHATLASVLGDDGADAVVREVAERLGAALPDGAVLGRTQLDQFGIFVSAGGGEGPTELVERIQDALGATAVFEDLTLAVEVTLGVATCPAHGVESGALMRRASQAMLAARAKRADARVFDQSMDSGAEQLKLVTELWRALEQGELVPFFQPQVSLISGEPFGVEALVRWRHPSRGLVPPGEFLPAASSSPIVRPLALRMVEQALAHARRWRDEGIHLRVSVNLSMLNLLDLEIAHEVALVLGTSRIPADMLRLEVTEDAVMADPERAVAVLGGLAAMGVGLSIDDYGTGYSSLSYLQRLPIDEVKIDRSFVQGLPASTRDGAIVRSTIGLAHELGLRVLAEGVESADAARELAKWRCDAAQGFHFGRPMPAEDVGEWVRSQADDGDAA